MIVITTMDKLPEGCVDCPMCHEGWCNAMENQFMQEIRPYNCPLKEINEPPEGGNKMKYNIKVGEKYLVGENIHETLKGTVTGDTTAVYSRFVGEMSAYDFCEIVDEAPCFDRVTACDYVRGIMERQKCGFYIGDIKLIDADHEETIVHCKHEENAKIIARILDMDNKDTFMTEEEIWGKDAVNKPPKEE